ncbi:PadR family transcriptional regulator [Flavilitoribacter nigricans]|uniref:PadR family transcriptional regulator n=1 Tax=Flavilitoribacter nigricans (strain ATCC 23147 / DSM 23189 / NBRC 102662 / NCIMB 1420 / SS-2) TaxID=1122177 RepID=A0A2D0N4X8_FLAN2|nr:PadR family transcriptional regulator [Flavilitoribacter nigricans]PHN03487.1 PadR family transcriptional regulator [Flavilitoribacter nigricans DSM 23189 = NBRC 102662]
MERIYLGEFEELVLLVVAVQQGEAYGVGVMEALEDEANRSVNISAVHAALRRLESKGFVKSEWSEATAERGGRRKRLFSITQEGSMALTQVRDVRVNLWRQIPGFSPNISFG